MELILWRHAEAEDGFNDLARKLTPKGHKQAGKMAAWLNLRLPRECRILSSPAVRARETAAALGREIEIVPTLAPGASVQAILQAAGWPDGSEDWVLIAGHQPDLGKVAGYLLDTQDALALKKAAVCWFSNRNHDGGNEVVLRAVLGPDLL